MPNPKLSNHFYYANKHKCNFCEKVEIKGHKDFSMVNLYTRKIDNDMRMSDLKKTQFITAIFELMTNVLKYAGSGFIIIENCYFQGKVGIKVSVIDSGPGITDLDAAMIQGYSTNKSLGLGLPGAKRLCDNFLIETVLGKGTKIEITKFV